MRRRTATEELIERVLGDGYLELKVDRYELTEDVANEGPCRVRAVLRHTGRNRTEEIEGEGVGFVDALYNGLMSHYAREFQSLETITFAGFSVKAQMETRKQATGADAAGLVRLVVHNSEGREFEFEESGRSLVAASIAVVVEAAEYFVNSERAFISVYNAVQDARERNRTDLVGTYTAQLAELVNTTSYTKVIERIKAETL